MNRQKIKRNLKANWLALIYMSLHGIIALVFVYKSKALFQAMLAATETGSILKNGFMIIVSVMFIIWLLHEATHPAIEIKEVC